MSQTAGNCPVCNKAFTLTDDTVICPACGAPYHRACYEKEGHCMFESKHGTGFEYVAPETAPGTENSTSSGQSTGRSPRAIVCSKCHASNDARNIFCEKCGNPLHAPQAAGTGPYTAPGAAPFGAAPGAGPFFSAANLTGEIDGIPKKDWSTFIGPSAATYLPRLSVQAQRKTKIGFLLSPLFISPFYFAYRKMWGWSLISLLVTIILIVPEVLSALYFTGNSLIAGIPVDTLNIIVNVIFYVGLAYRFSMSMFAIYLYRRNAGKKIKQLREQHTNDVEYQMALVSKGGISVPAVLAVLAVFIAVWFVVFYFFGSDLMAYATQAYNAL